MKETEQRIVGLISKRLRRNISEAEERELEAWKTLSAENRVFAEKYDDPVYLNTRLKELGSVSMEKGFRKLSTRAGWDMPGTRRINRWPLAAAAAAILLLLVTVIYLNNSSNIEGEAVADGDANEEKQAILPGSDKAILYLSDNSTVVLDSASQGLVALQGDSRVVKNGDGSIRYTSVAGEQGEHKIAFNKLMTPKAAQYQLVLPDGSKAWLNSGSSIRYPTYFAGNERKVEITGEVYFEVARNIRMPFKVAFNGGQLEVLGTHFNINTYGDTRDVEATLLEGSVKLIAAPADGRAMEESLILAPGQQAAYNNGERIIVKRDADVEQVMAWKEGYFIYDNTSLKVILKQLARWYDLDVEYQTDDEPHFSFKLSRYDDFSSILGILEKTGAIRFETSGRKIKVLKG